MKKANGFTKRVAAILLSSMLAVGTFPGNAIASEVQENTVQEEEAITTYAVTLDANGGYFENEWDDVLGDYIESTEILNKLIPDGETVTIYPVYETDDQQTQIMSFVGWSLERDGEPISQGDEEYTPVDNCVLYAVWQSEEILDNSEETDSHESDEVEIVSEDDSLEEQEDTVSFDEEDTGDVIDDVGDQEEPASENDDQADQTVDVIEEENTSIISEENTDSDGNANDRAQDEVIIKEPVNKETVSTEKADSNINESTTITGSLGDTINWSLDTEQKKLIIEGSGAIEDCSKSPWINYVSDIESIILSDGILAIGKNSFLNLTEVKTVQIADSVEAIGYKAFANCKKLINVNIPLSWRDCPSSSTSGTLNTSYCGHIFEGCEKLTEITVPQGMTKLPGFAFNACGSLTKINVPDTLRSIGNQAFYNCSGLTDFVIPDGVEQIGKSAFYGCSSLCSLNIPHGINQVSSYTFSHCSSMQVITIPNTVVTINEYAFDACTNLSTLVFDGTEEEWSAIDKSSTGNSILNSVSIIFGTSLLLETKDFVGVWEGEYDGHHGNDIIRRHFVMTIDECTVESGNIAKISGSTAISQSTEKPSEYFVTGIDKISGTVNLKTGSISFQGTEWIQYPDGADNYTSFSHVIFDGYMSSDKQAISGIVEKTRSRTFYAEKTASSTTSGLWMTIFSNKNDILDGGHAFLNIENETDKDVYIGNYKLSAGDNVYIAGRTVKKKDEVPVKQSKGGIFYNWEGEYDLYVLEEENSHFYQDFAWYTVGISKEDLVKLYDVIKGYGTYDFFTNNCTHFATTAWNAIVDEKYKVPSTGVPGILKTYIVDTLKGKTATELRLDDKDITDVLILDSNGDFMPYTLNNGEYFKGVNSLKVVEYDSTSVTLEWISPAITYCNNKYNITKICVAVTDDNGKRSTIDLPPDSITYTVTDLIPGTHYSFKIYGVSDHISTNAGIVTGQESLIKCEITTDKIVGWYEDDGEQYFYKEDGTKLTNGWAKNGTTWYWMDENGKITKNKWIQTGGKWYYMSSSGSMTTGWQQISGKWYYMNSRGVMTTGWQQIGNKWYYMNSSGAMTTGWQKIGGKWYYMNSSGAMTTGWQKIDGKWYYMNSSGIMTTGWQQIGGKWYYMNSSGIMTTGWQQIGGKWYYMNSSGQMVTGTQVIGGKTYVFNSSGVWVK